MARRVTRWIASLLVVAFSSGIPPVYASQRSWQPLVLQASQLSFLIGWKSSSLEVMASHHGRLEPIPFQVDQVLADGEFKFTEPRSSKAGDPADKLGPHDEVVMMVSDFGERIADTKLLPANSFEIELRDSLGGANRYAYIAAVVQPHLSARTYVNYEPGLHTMKTDSYYLTMRNELPDSFVVEQSNNQPGKEIARGFEAEARAPLFNLFSVRFTQRDIRSEVLAYKTGPIRVIRKLRHRVDLGLGIHSPSVMRTDLFYRDSIDEPFVVDLPWIPALLFGNISARADTMLRVEPEETLSWSDLGTASLRLDDGTLASNIQSHSKADWLMLGTRSGTLVGIFLPTPAMEAVSPQLYYRGGTSSQSDDVDTRPRLGYLLSGWQRLPIGRHRFDFVLVQVPRDYPVATLRQELRVQPAVKIHSVGPRAEAAKTGGLH
jgi:hypothetical protein